MVSVTSLVVCSVSVVDLSLAVRVLRLPHRLLWPALTRRERRRLALGVRLERARARRARRVHGADAHARAPCHTRTRRESTRVVKRAVG